MSNIRELATMLNVSYSQAHRLIINNIVKATFLKNGCWDILDDECKWALDVNDNYCTVNTIANKANVHTSSVNIAINRLGDSLNEVYWTHGMLRYSPSDVEKIINKMNEINSHTQANIYVGVYNNNKDLIGVYKSISSATNCLLGVGRTTIRYRLDKRTVGRKGFMILSIDKSIYDDNTQLQEKILDYNPPENKKPIKVKYTDYEGNTIIFTSQREASKHLGVSQSLVSRIINNDILYKSSKERKIAGTLEKI